ncbi:GTP-binding protein [Perkinsela sp. CCAP 1560/4]|nr:GTP-binding protein [Perkinsela sp. CCAP 1560/4]|eukprot:KNH06084.1 GTP-binding protein [Perkinsela sp. CCAP 1560/4]
MVRLKRLQSRYKEAFQTDNKSAMSNQAFMDFTDKGAAWFIGNMAKTKIDLERKLKKVDFVLEVRDARLPFTTANPDVDSLTKDKPRLIIFNKADIANAQCNQVLAHYYESLGTHVVFTNAEVAWKQTLRSVIRFVTDCVPSTSFKTAPHVGLLVGMPNVGKSSILNALRVAHEFQFQRQGCGKPREQVVSIKPGSTRHITTVPVSIDPPICIMDTPGLTVPGNFSFKAGRKLALMGIIPTNCTSIHISDLAKTVYAIYLNSGMVHHLAECLRISRVPVCFDDLVSSVGNRSGSSANNQLNRLNRDIVHSLIVDDFQSGRLGRITLDNIPSMTKALNLDKTSKRGSNEEASIDDRIPEEQEVLPSKNVEFSPGVDASWGSDMKDALSQIHNLSHTISRKQGPIAKCAPNFKIKDPC